MSRIEVFFTNAFCVAIRYALLWSGENFIKNNKENNTLGYGGHSK